MKLIIGDALIPNKNPINCYNIKINFVLGDMDYEKDENVRIHPYHPLLIEFIEFLLDCQKTRFSGYKDEFRKKYPKFDLFTASEDDYDGDDDNYWSEPKPDTPIFLDWFNYEGDHHAWVGGFDIVYFNESGIKCSVEIKN